MNTTMTPTTAAPIEYNSAELERMLSMRLRSQREKYFQHWHCHKVDDTKVVVLVVSKGETVLLEDEWPLFPSDALITKLRLLEQ